MIRRLLASTAAALCASTLVSAAVPQPGEAAQPLSVQKNAVTEMPSRTLDGIAPAPESFRAAQAAIDIASLPAPEKATAPSIDAQGRLRIASVRALPKAAPVAEWQFINDGFVNTLRASSDGAKGLRVQLQVERRAAPLEIRAMGTDGRVELLVADPALGSEIWTPWTDGSSQVIELFSPSGAPIPAVSVVSVLHFDASPFEKVAAGSCTVPVSCSTSSSALDDAIAERAKSSVRITFVEGNSGFLCSATLLNSELHPVGYLLTANHCVSTAASAASVILLLVLRPDLVHGYDARTGQHPRSAGTALVFTNYNPDGTLLRMNDRRPRARATRAGPPRASRAATPS
jgi:hypothetical protein